MDARIEDIVFTAQSAGLPSDVLKSLVNRAYDRAKWWGTAVLSLQVILWLGGMIAIFLPRFTLTYPWIAVPVALLGVDISRRASNYKGMAESAKRHHEFVDGFGLKPSGSQLADLRQTLRAELSADVDRCFAMESR